MHDRQLIRRIRRAAVALAAGLALTAVATAPASAAGSGTILPGPNSLNRSAHATVPAQRGATTGPVRRLVRLPAAPRGAAAQPAAGPVATTCIADVGPPVLSGNQVSVKYSVKCDNQVERFLGAVGIARNGTELLGNSFVLIDARGSGFEGTITRQCASGVLYGDMLVQVTFRNGTPRQITGEFFGPAVEVGC